MATPQFSQPEFKQKYEIMRQGGAWLNEILQQAKEICQPGISAAKIDRFCYQKIKAKQCEPSFLGYQNFPNSLVFCLNHEVVHGIPIEDKVIQANDLVTLDLGLTHQGLVVDHAISFVAGENQPASRLIKITQDALQSAIAVIKPGIKVGDISHTVESIANNNKVFVIYECAGHGVGKSVHTPPSIPNYGRPNQGTEIKEGMTLAIEPIFSLGTNYTFTLSDQWTVITDDDSLCAQSEHSIIVTQDGCEVLTLPMS